MHARGAERFAAHHLRQPLPGEGLADVAAGDVFLEPGKGGLEGLEAVAKQRRIRHAAGIEGAEDDSGGGVVAPMELRDRDHVAELAVLIGLAGFEGPAVGHGNGIAKPGGKATQVTEVGWRRDGDFAAQLLGVGGNGANHNQALLHLVLRLLLPGRRGATTAAATGIGQFVQQQLDQQEVAQVVGGHGQLVALGRKQGLPQGGHVDGGVAHQRVQRSATAVDGSGKGPHAPQVREVKGNNRQVPAIHLQLRDGAIGTGRVTHGHHHVPAALHQGGGAVQPDAGAGPGDDGLGPQAGTGGHGCGSEDVGVVAQSCSGCFQITRRRLGAIH